MACGCEILLLLIAQGGAPTGVPRFVSMPLVSNERHDQRVYASTCRLASVRPFPLFDDMNESLAFADALKIDIDFDGDVDQVVAIRFGRARLSLNDGNGNFTEAPLLEGREVLCAARFAAFTDLDGDGRPELFIAAPADPVGEAVLASKPPWIDGLARRVQRDAATFVSGGVVIACSKEGRRDVTESLGLARLAPFRAGAVADFDGDGAPEIVLFGGESDDMAAFWKDVVPTFARVGADPAGAAAAMASLAPPKPPYPAPRMLKREANGRFAPVAAEFPAELARFNVASVSVIDFDPQHPTDLLLEDDDGASLLLRNALTNSPETAKSDPGVVPSGFIVRAAVPTPAPALELTAVNGARVKLDGPDARPALLVRLDVVADARAAASLAAEARQIDWADVILLDANATDEVSMRAKTVASLVSELLTGSRDAATVLCIGGDWIGRDGFIEVVAGGATLAQFRRRSAGVSVGSKGDNEAALVALPRAEREAHLPNLALAALTKLESAGNKGLDFEFGRVLSETRKPAEAAARFEKVSKDSSDYPRAQLELGRCLARTNRIADARAAFERAVDVAPADPGARFELGRLLLQSKEKSEAEAGTESLRVATYLKPEFADAQYAFGQGLARIGRHDEAITALERALALAPEAPQARPARELLENLRQKKGS